MVAKLDREAPVSVDPLLEPFFATNDRATRERILGDLLTQHAEPVIRRGLRHRFGPTQSPEIEDIRSSVIVRLLNRLERAEDETDGIQSFADYVAMVTYNTIDDYARRRNPQRTLLANRLRYVLTHDERFALWRSDRDLVCGLSAWSSRRAQTQTLDVHDADERELADSLDRAFRRGGMPIDFHDVVQAFASAAGLNEATMPVNDIDVIDAAPSAYERIAAREAADALWSEIVSLPLRQRLALLLGARDAAGQSAVSMFPATGVATIGAIASVLEIPLDELAAIWNDLPLDDNTIAARLGASRQQVINLRKSARDRLARRLRRR